MPTTLERVSKVVVEHLDCNPENVTPTAKLVDDLGADSLDQIELIMAMEEEFDVEIPDDEAEGWKTVQAVADGIDAKLKAAA